MCPFPVSGDKLFRLQLGFHRPQLELPSLHPIADCLIFSELLQKVGFDLGLLGMGVRVSMCVSVSGGEHTKRW
jgi:hypothetical protein